jgi:2-haloacid dehalogenase
MSPSLRSFRALSFDCYGTLIDWQSGILGALRPLLAGAGRDRSDAAIIADFAAHERRIESGPYLPYREVLRGVALAVIGSGLPLAAAQALPNSLARWAPFPDTNPALARLARRFPLGIASNVDNDLFAATRGLLTVPFAAIVTAQEVRSYKPADPHFHELTHRLRLAPAEILHVAESRYHDIEPAGRLGFGTVWINRSGAAPSASGPGGGDPMWTFPSLAALADAVDAERLERAVPGPCAH